MSKSKVFIGVCLSVSVGVFLASAFVLDLRYAYGLMGLGAMVFTFSFFKEQKAVRLSGLFLFFMALGFLRFHQTVVPNEYESVFESKVRWEGYIVEDIDMRADKQLLTVRPKGYSQKVLITTTKAQKFFYGDWVLFEGKIKKAEAFDGFDYPGYLERFGVYALVQYPKVIILKNNQGNALKHALLKIKSKFAERASSYLKEPENGLALGILIGARRGLPEEVVENFNLTGTSHIVAISGFNITIIITSLGFLAWLIGRRLSFWVSLFLILGFVVIAGGSASVIRAAVMGIILLASFNTGRMYSVAPAMFLAGAAMLWLNPKILYWDIGFQLSYAATIGLVYFMPLLDNLTQNWPKVFGLKSILLGTLAATVSTLPLILWYFERLSVVAVLANILILPVVPFAMLFGALVAVPFLAPGFAFCASLLLSYILFITAKLASLPYASVEIKIESWMLIAMLSGLAAVYFLLKKLVKTKILTVEPIKPL